MTINFSYYTERESDKKYIKIIFHTRCVMSISINGGIQIFLLLNNIRIAAINLREVKKYILGQY